MFDREQHQRRRFGGIVRTFAPALSVASLVGLLATYVVPAMDGLREPFIFSSTAFVLLTVWGVTMR